MTHALYPGTFDPITYGHIRIVERTVPLFDKITVGVSCNRFKDLMFTTDERIKMIRDVLSDCPNINIVQYDNLTVEFARDINADVIIRGLRAVTDYVSEVQMAIMNRSIAPDIETLLMVSEEGYSFVSSSLIKEIVFHGGPIDHLVPETVASKLRKKLKEKLE
ncbi:pantetheine-phosphate adenylyltransferase [bacterium]|nr:pantetheine-phosphate adenylyltransferase [bacterium]